ncbi:hypothetical protein OPV22_033661 [Ensete ventricosum]|uniref:Uncharacterized protein n=1 Tax=Ensete ventricosum TaxID=4639 RepID=A0AAV8P2G3_ENSVE|nr:hypothetical protein OPV22_033661 [Ensete ventricosum]
MRKRRSSRKEMRRLGHFHRQELAKRSFHGQRHPLPFSFRNQLPPPRLTVIPLFGNKQRSVSLSLFTVNEEWQSGRERGRMAYRSCRGWESIYRKPSRESNYRIDG